MTRLINYAAIAIALACSVVAVSFMTRCQFEAEPIPAVYDTPAVDLTPTVDADAGCDCDAGAGERDD